MALINSKDVLFKVQMLQGARGDKGEKGATITKVEAVEAAGNVAKYRMSLSDGTTADFDMPFTEPIKKSALLDMIYPVGSIYMSANAASPATFFGGTWQRIQGKFLLAADDTYSAGATGGEAEHTLTVEEMPNHRHSSDSYMNGYPDSKFMLDVYNYSTWTNEGNSYNNNPDTGQNGQVRTSYVGGGQPHNNMPPYLAVYVWKRTA